MEKITKKILENDVNLSKKVSEIVKLFNQTSKTKTYSLSKLDSTLMKTMEDALSIKEKWHKNIILFY